MQNFSNKYVNPLTSAPSRVQYTVTVKAVFMGSRWSLKMGINFFECSPNDISSAMNPQTENSRFYRWISMKMEEHLKENYEKWICVDSMIVPGRNPATHFTGKQK